MNCHLIAMRIRGLVKGSKRNSLGFNTSFRLTCVGMTDRDSMNSRLNA